MYTCTHTCAMWMLSIYTLSRILILHTELQKIRPTSPVNLLCMHTHVQLQAHPDTDRCAYTICISMSAQPPAEVYTHAHTYTLLTHKSMWTHILCYTQSLCINTCTILRARVGEQSPGPGMAMAWQLCMGRRGQAHAIGHCRPVPQASWRLSP